MNGAILFTPCMPSWCGQGQLYYLCHIKTKLVSYTTCAVTFNLCEINFGNVNNVSCEEAMERSVMPSEGYST